MSDRTDEHGDARVDACVILAGGLRPSPLAREAGASVLDMWFGFEAPTLLDHWLSRLAPALRGGAPVFIVHDANSPRPRAPVDNRGLPVHVMREPRAYRGPAGVVLDVCRELEDDQRVLIADAARLVAAGLPEVLREHERHAGGTTVVANPDRTPAGMYITTRAALGLAPERGFMDLKEQWLAKVRNVGAGAVWVHTLTPPGAMPLRTRDQALGAACALVGGGAQANGRAVWGVEESPGQAGFRAVAPGAEISQGSVIVDSVVMGGAVVGEGGVVVRSLVLAGARVEAGAEVVDAVVSAGGVVSPV